jgi:hypothetical protein
VVRDRAVLETQVALLVNEKTLLPALMPLAPATSFLTRIGHQIAALLAAHGTPPAIIDDELDQMRPCRVARTANRSVVGTMTEFTHLAEAYRHGNPDPDLLALALRLSTNAVQPPVRQKHQSRPRTRRAPTLPHHLTSVRQQPRKCWRQQPPEVRCWI